MVQPEIQAAQDAALGPQKLGLRERSSSQEAEGGGLRVEGGKEVLLPALERCVVSFLVLSFLVCKMEPLICCLEVVRTVFRVRKTWVRFQTLPFTHTV